MPSSFSPSEVVYPSEPDGRGSARVNYRRQSYYFGKHGTPHSMVLFALWKQELMEKGEPMKVSELKVLASSHLARFDAPHDRHKKERGDSSDTSIHYTAQRRLSILWSRIRAPAIAIAYGICVALSTFILMGAFSVNEDKPMVDGIPLSAEDERFVRSIRRMQAITEAEIAKADETLHIRARKLQEMGPEDAKRFIAEQRERRKKTRGS